MLHRSIPILLLAGLLVACSSSPLDGDSKEKLVELYAGNAQLYFEGGHYRSALAQANQVLALDDDHQKARFVRAMSMLNIGDPKDIQLARNELEELVEEDFDARQYKVWLGLAMARAAVGDLYDARHRRLTGEIEADPGRARTLTPARNEARKNRDDSWRGSIEACQAVLSYTDIPLAKNDPTSLYYLYRNHSLLGDHTQALQFELRHLRVIEGSRKRWEESLERYPDAQRLYEQKLAGARTQELAVRDMMASTYYHLGRYDDALDQLDHLVSMSPDRANTYLNRAQVNRKLGRHDRAVVDLKRFIQKTDLEPEDPQAMEAVALLRDSEAKMADSP